MTNEIITRFAPSPTGFLHIGNIRTALFSWLYIKKYKGKFILRIDDTDVSRISKKYLNNIFDILNWLNIEYNEIAYQSQNIKLYNEKIKQLLKDKKAYKCFCSKERLNKLKNDQIENKKRIKYDKHCKYKNNDNNNNDFVVRIDSEIYEDISFFDEIRGNINIKKTEIDDFIILKTDKSPTYNFSSAIDDIDKNISIIIRGEDHISNTPKQILIINAFNKKIPKFLHLPLILNEDKKVLSKRNKDFSINYYKNNGYLSEALLNYILRLSFSYKDKEIFTINEMIDHFHLKNINKSQCLINKKKLKWLNNYFIKRKNEKELYIEVLNISKKFNLNYSIGPNFKNLIKYNKERVSLIDDFIKNNIFLYKTKVYIDFKLKNKYITKNNIILLKKIFNKFKKYNKSWNIESIKKIINEIIITNKIKLKDLAMPLRVIITGSENPRPIFDILFLCGKILILKKIINIIKEYGGAVAQKG